MLQHAITRIRATLTSGICIAGFRASNWVLLVSILTGTLILAAAVHAYNRESSKRLSVTSPSRTPLTRGPKTQVSSVQRKLSFQPEADRFRRRLGKRFTEPGRERAMLVGTLTAGVQRFQARIVRSLGEDGEEVEIQLNGGGPPLTWNGKDGGKAAGQDATAYDRSLIERIALDSPDQFILSQLRGASYYKIAQSVAPANAAEDYSGPVWDLIRIVEPQQGAWARPENIWRIYYINNATGMIDKILYQERGQNITVEFFGWTTQGGETDPSLIRWSREGKVEMELSITNSSHGSR